MFGAELRYHRTRANLSARPDGNLADLEDQVAARIARQNILDRTGAPQLWCILDEGVLNRAIGGSKVMHGQLYQVSGRGTMDVTGSAWRKSSYSGSNGGACIEVGTAGPAVAIRDSNDQAGPQLALPTATWKAFTGRLKAVTSA